MQANLSDGKWSSIVLRVCEIVDLEATAENLARSSACVKSRRAQDMLRLALMYGPGHLSLGTTAAMAADASIMTVSDKGLLDRLRTMGDWLEHLLQQLLQTQRGLACADTLSLGLVKIGSPP